MSELTNWLSTLFDLAADPKANLTFQEMKKEMPDWTKMDIKGDYANYLVTREAVGEAIKIKRY